MPEKTDRRPGTAVQSDGSTADRKAVPRGHTHSGQQTGSPEPRSVVDRDESSDSQASATQSHVEVGKAAYKDAAGPAQDTDRSALTDKVYNEKLVKPDKRG